MSFDNESVQGRDSLVGMRESERKRDDVRNSRDRMPGLGKNNTSKGSKQQMDTVQDFADAVIVPGMNDRQSKPR